MVKFFRMLPNMSMSRSDSTKGGIAKRTCPRTEQIWSASFPGRLELSIASGYEMPMIMTKAMTLIPRVTGSLPAIRPATLVLYCVELPRLPVKAPPSQDA